jgi:peptidoglycan-N-acetylglucosamine deacetylase
MIKFYWIKTNVWVKKIFSNHVWDIPNTENKIYLTFDDGPTPDVTEWVLAELKKKEAKATFFCIGKNIDSNPELFKKITEDGHTIGNHTLNHLNGWKTKTDDYQENTLLCQTKISEHIPNNNKIFRPPYGKIKSSQSKRLRRLGFKIVMWDVLSADFDKNITPEECLDNVIKNVVTGSIIVFHDSKKAYKNLEYTLPRALQILKERGFVFDTLNQKR